MDFRIAALKKLQKALQENEGAIADALYSDLGKSREESYMCETGIVLAEISYMIKHIRRFSREQKVATPLAQFASRSYRKTMPYGVVLIMSPWNYPLMLTLDPLVDALAAGNTAIVKPSAYSPATSAILARILGDIFQEEYVAVVTGGREENGYLLDGEKVAFGGQYDAQSLKIAPTIMENVTWDDAVMGEEIFGPILP